MIAWGCYYLLEGISIMVSMWFLVTKFFGESLKMKFHVKKVSGILLLCYTVLGWGLSVSAGERKAVNGILFLVLSILFLLSMDVKKSVAFFVLLSSVEVFVVFLGFLYMFFSLLPEKITGSVLSDLLLYLVLTCAVIIPMSLLSCRRRKGRMAFPLVIATFMVFILADNFFSLLFPFYNNNSEPPVSFRFVLSESEDTPSVLLLFICGVILAAFVLLLIKEAEALYYREKNAVSEYYLETQKAHYERLSVSNLEVRKMRHDMKNHILVMSELLKQEHYTELRAYLEEVAESAAKADIEVHVGNEIADAIILEKMQQLRSIGGTLNVEGAFGRVSLSAMDTCTILANILDNSIEAVQELDTEKRRVHLSFRNNAHYLILSVKNPVKTQVVMTGHVLPATKKNPENHGFGMINIKEAVSRYDGECLFSSYEEEGTAFFEVEILLPLCTSVASQSYFK